VQKLSGLECCTRLRVLYLANNQLKDFRELDCVPQSVEELSLVGNPLQEAAAKAEGPTSALGCAYRLEVLRRLPNLRKLDGVTVDTDEKEAAAQKRMESSKGAAGLLGTRTMNSTLGAPGTAPGTAGSAGRGLGATAPPPGAAVVA
jgi:hypothetical protein